MDVLKGFTLIELVMVLILISILAVFASINWPGRSINLAAQAEQLVNDIRYAQTLGMTKGQRYRWVKTSATSYQITNNSGTAIIMPSGGTTITLGTGISFGTLINLPNNLIAFDGQGIPYIDTATPGTALAANASIPLTADGQTKTIVVSPQTGRVIIQ